MRPRYPLLPLFFCFLFSAAAHLLVVVLVPAIGSYHFTRPLASSIPPVIDFIDIPPPFVPPVKTQTGRIPLAAAISRQGGHGSESGARRRELASGEIVAVQEDTARQVVKDRGAPVKEARAPEGSGSHSAGAPLAGGSPLLFVPSSASEGPRQVRNAQEFLAARREKLTYRISMLGVPVGSAVLEAVNEGTDLRITTVLRSNELFSQVYQVADFAETRLIGGNYIVARRRQQEGNFRSDTGFTLCFRERQVVWADRLRNVVMTQPLPTNEALDVLSAFYLLRSLPLMVGETQMLHIFDDNVTVATPVEVLREERIRLPGLREVDTLVVRPLLQTDGLFRRSGEILIWLTADEFRVPVKIESAISLGKATAELVSAETTYPPHRP